MQYIKVLRVRYLTSGSVVVSNMFTYWIIGFVFAMAPITINNTT